MENETMNQNVPIQNMQSGIPVAPVAPPQSSSRAALYVVVGVVAVIAAAAVWYLSSLPQTQPAAPIPTATEQTQPAQSPASGNTTADISADLNQIPDSSAELGADAAAVSGDLQSL